MQTIHKGRQNSEVKRKVVLTKLASIRIEAEKIGAEDQLLERIDTIEQNIKSARVDVRKYRDFLREENNQLEALQEALNTMKETKHKKSINHMKATILLSLVGALPLIVTSKFHYLSVIPKKIPISSVIIYLGIGDILFYTWIVIYVFYLIAYRYITTNYINPFIEKNPPLKM